MGLEVLYLLIPVTVLLALIALGLFLWAIHAGQFDDLDTPAIRILLDDESRSAAEAAPPPTPGEGAGDARRAGQAPSLRPSPEGAE